MKRKQQALLGDGYELNFPGTLVTYYICSGFVSCILLIASKQLI
jgi:hypothetical protein